MKRAFAFGLATLAPCLISSQAIADEMWETEEFNVVYEADRGNTAIWDYGDGFGKVFIEGLAGEYENRGTYSGYWSQKTASTKCDTYREGVDGEPTYYWGNVEVEFIDPDFPSRWTLRLGLCEQPSPIELNGTPIIP